MVASIESQDCFHHDPMEGSLRQIRLLRFGLHRPERQSQETISLTIETHNIVQAPPCHAISYLWGVDRAVHKVTMNGKSVKLILSHKIKPMSIQLLVF